MLASVRGEERRVSIKGHRGRGGDTCNTDELEKLRVLALELFVLPRSIQLTFGDCSESINEGLAKLKNVNLGG